MIREQGNSVNLTFRNFGIDSNGYFVEDKKEPTEGFREFTKKNGKVVYRRTVGAFEGYLRGVEIGDFVFEGRKIPKVKLTFIDYDCTEAYTIDMGIWTQKEAMGNYLASFIKYLPSIDLKEKLLISTFKKKKGDEFAPGSFFIAYPRKGEDGKDLQVPIYYKQGQNGFPDREKYETPTGEKYDYRKQGYFLYEKLQKYIDHLSKNRPEIKDLKPCVPDSSEPAQSAIAPVDKPIQAVDQPKTPPAYSQPAPVQPPVNTPPAPPVVSTPPDYPPISSPEEADDDLPF